MRYWLPYVKFEFFNKIDLSKAYHQVAVEPLHMHKTTFLTKHKLFKFLVLPFGLVNALAKFYLVNSF